MQALRKKRKKQTGENMDIINKRYMNGELAPDTPKAPNEPMAIDPNAKVMQGAMSGDGNDKKGKSCISHIQLCSSPSFPLKDVSSSENSLLSSLEKITTWDWDGASLVLEHCDSQSVDGSYQKGFMSIEAELRIVDYLQESGLGMVLNWGRSVLEGRSPSTILDHIDLCQQKGCLKGFIFSGTSKNDPSYGSWEDQHMPFFREASKIKGLENSLLNEENANLTLDRLNKEALSYIGFKLQLLPQEEVSVEDRVEINFDAQEILQNKY